MTLMSVFKNFDHFDKKCAKIIINFSVHCRTLHPIFRNVAKKYRENKDIMFARMDLGEFKPIDLKVSVYIPK